MSNIDIHAHHTMNREQAQQAAEDLSKDLADKFSIEYGWEGDVLHFQRTGVHGQIEVNDDVIHIQAHLGFMLAFLQKPIEEEIRRHLSECFGCTF